jgi:chromosome segregation ATPase
MPAFEMASPCIILERLKAMKEQLDESLQILQADPEKHAEMIPKIKRKIQQYEHNISHYEDVVRDLHAYVETHFPQAWEARGRTRDA